MIAFEVSVNSRKVCVAGVEDLGVLTAILTWVRREAKNAKSKAPKKIDEELRLDVGGFISSKNEHVRWIENKLTAGDEVCVRVVDLDSVDPPRHRIANDPTGDTERQQKYVEQMAKQFGWRIQK